MAASAVRNLITPHIRPQTQNTAPVLEYRCLHTSDIRRKQKRWQDGRLKFHTFNKRVMVYDDQGNFVGDAHWHEDYEFEEGLEMELERSGTLVQVSECLGEKNQDLTGLWEKRQKEREEKGSKETATSFPLLPPHSIAQTPACVLPHSSESQSRSTKRRRLNDSPPAKNGYAQNLTGATLTLSGRPPSTATLRYDPLLKRMLKLPIADVNPLGRCSTTGLKKGVMQSKNYRQEDKKRTGAKAGQSLLESSDARPTRSLTEAPLTLNGEAVHTSAVENDDISNKACNSDLGDIATQDDGFKDIDVYVTKPAQSSTTLDICQKEMIDKNRATLSAKKPQSLPHHTLVRSVGGDWNRCEKLFSPLRIRARPKRKLLLIARSQPNQPANNKLLKLKDDTEADLPMLQQGSEDVSRAGKAVSAFPLFQDRRRSTGTALERCAIIVEQSSSETERLDHHLMDALLSRAPFEGLGRTRGQPSKVQISNKLSDAPLTVNKYRDRLLGVVQDELNVNNSIADCLSSLQAGKEQVNTQQQVQEMLMTEDNSNSNSQSRVCIKAEAVSYPVLHSSP